MKRAGAFYGLFLVLGLLAFGSGLSNPFVFDDRATIEQNQWLHWEFLPNFFRSFIHDSSMSFPGYRPLLMASFVIQREISGLDPFAYRAANLALLALLTTLIFLFLTDLKIGNETFKPAALAASILFLVHPIQTNLITLVWKRSDLFVGLGIVGTLWLFTRWAEDERGRLRCLVGAYVATLMALLSKESALILPACLWIAEGSLWKSRRSIRSRVFAIHLPVIAAVFAFAIIIFVIQPQMLTSIGYETRGNPPEFELGRWEYFRTQFAALWSYARYALIPVPLQVYHDIAPVRSLKDPRLITGIAFLLAWIGFAIWVRAKDRRVTFFMLLALLLFLPSSSLIPLHMIFDEDRLSLPLFPLTVLAVLAVRFLLAQKKASTRWPAASLSKSLVALFLVLYVTGSSFRMREWRNEVALWASNIDEAPQNPIVWNAFGGALEQSGHLAAAVEAFEKAVRLRPDYANGYLRLANSLFAMKRWDESVEPLFRAMEQPRLIPDAFRQLGAMAVMEENPGKAARYFQLAIGARPSDPVFRRDLGVLLHASGEAQAAEQAFRTAYLLNPFDDETRIQWALSLSKSSVDQERARRLLDPILKQDPSNLRARKALDRP